MEKMGDWMTSAQRSEFLRHRNTEIDCIENIINHLEKEIELIKNNYVKQQASYNKFLKEEEKNSK